MTTFIINIEPTTTPSPANAPSSGLPHINRLTYLFIFHSIYAHYHWMYFWFRTTGIIIFNCYGGYDIGLLTCM